MALNGTQAYALSKKYTEDSLDGVGALKGAPCTIKSYTHQNGRSTIVFEWTSNSGVVSETTVTVLDGTPIYEWQSGDFYDYSDLVIYASCFYRCITPNSDVEFDDTKWNELGSADGNYDIVQNSTLLPSIFTAADRKMYYSIEDEEFYFWNGYEWVIQKKLIQYDALPVASSTNVNEVVQYLGATSDGLTHGYFYECVEDSGIYSWNEVKVQDTHVEASETNGNIVIDGVETPVYDDTEIDGRLDDVEQDLSTSTKSVTGNPLNFSTLTAQKANETVISLEPIQDLHGYDHPWPAGGGKNKLPNTGSTDTINGITFAKNDDGTVLATGTATANAFFRISANIGLSSGDYVLNGCPSGGSNSTYYIYTQSSSGQSVFQDFGQGVNVNYDGSYTIQSFIGIRNGYACPSGGLLFKPMIRLATETDATFAPYENKCPIDGRTETSLVGCGKNELDISTLALRDVTGTGEERISFVPKKLKAGKWTFSFSGNQQMYITNVSNGYSFESVSASPYTFTANGDDVYMVRTPFTNISHVTNTNFQLEYGEQATAYEPFVESNNLTIQFGEKVYGATVELEKGTVTVDTGIVDLGDLEWTLAGSAQIRHSTPIANITPAPKIVPNSVKMNGVCSDYQIVKGELIPETDPSIGMLNQTGIWVNDSRYDGEPGADFKAHMSGVKLCYKLATPRTIQLTPNEISLLLGVNVISSDADGITLTYRDGKVATLGDLDSLNVALNDALQDTAADLSDDITTAQNTANTALAYAQNKVYGMRIRESVESNPASIISYLADAVGMTPVHMDYTNNVFDYGSWEDVWFIKDCKPCILGQDGVVQAYLNKNDYTKDIYGNTVTIDENLTGANVMIEFPKIWYKIVPVVPTCCDADVFISPVKLDDDYKDFAYIAQDKTHKEHFYLPAYNGSIINDGTNDVLRSLSGQAVGNNKTGTVEIEMAQRNGTGWYTETFSQVTLINLLLMLIGKSTDTHTVFGRGIDTGSQTAFNAYRTGTGNTKGMFWGSNDGTQLVKVFGIENWWALQWRRFGGLMCVNGTFKYKMCWGQEDGSTTDNYNTDASGYIESPSPAPSGTSGGYISRMFFTSVNMLMSVIGGSSSTKYCDGGLFNNLAKTYAFRGCRSAAGALCGAFALAVSAAVSIADWGLGAALSYT